MLFQLNKSSQHVRAPAFDVNGHKNAGRVIFVRGQGKLIFYTLRGAGSDVQIMCNAR